MGPYCKFCDNRCFVYFPEETPVEALKAYRSGITIIATCPDGQAFEKNTTGWCYDDIIAAIEARHAAAQERDPEETDSALYGPLTGEQRLTLEKILAADDLT